VKEKGEPILVLGEKGEKALSGRPGRQVPGGEEKAYVKEKGQAPEKRVKNITDWKKGRNKGRIESGEIGQVYKQLK